MSEYDIIIINAAKYLLRCAVIKDIYDSILLSWAEKGTHAVYGNKEEQLNNILKLMRDTPRRAPFGLLRHLR